MIDYEVLFYRLLGYVVNEVGMDVEETLDEIGVQNLHEQEEIISSFEDSDEEEE